MKKLLKKLQEKAGYVSIETVVIAGLMLALGTFAVQQLYEAGDAVTTQAIDNVNSVLSLEPGAGGAID